MVISTLRPQNTLMQACRRVGRWSRYRPCALFRPRRRSYSQLTSMPKECPINAVQLQFTPVQSQIPPASFSVAGQKRPRCSKSFRHVIELVIFVAARCLCRPSSGSARSRVAQPKAVLRGKFFEVSGMGQSRLTKRPTERAQDRPAKGEIDVSFSNPLCSDVQKTRQPNVPGVPCLPKGDDQEGSLGPFRHTRWGAEQEVTSTGGHNRCPENSGCPSRPCRNSQAAFAAPFSTTLLLRAAGPAPCARVPYRRRSLRMNTIPWSVTGMHISAASRAASARPEALRPYVIAGRITLCFFDAAVLFGGKAGLAFGSADCARRARNLSIRTR